MYVYIYIWLHVRIEEENKIDTDYWWGGLCVFFLLLSSTDVTKTQKDIMHATLPP